MKRVEPDEADGPRKLLFVCSRNRIRSLTAERLFDGSPTYAARSVGTAENARVRVTAGHLGWADVVFVMEPRHRDLLRRRFGGLLAEKPVVCLDVPDEFAPMDADLIDLLRTRLSSYVAVPAARGEGCG